jgi:hypothetical protein
MADAYRCKGMYKESVDFSARLYEAMETHSPQSTFGALMNRAALSG